VYCTVVLVAQSLVSTPIRYSSNTVVQYIVRLEFIHSSKRQFDFFREIHVKKTVDVRLGIIKHVTDKFEPIMYYGYSRGSIAYVYKL
jgi:hypothetical protein